MSKPFLPYTARAYGSLWQSAFPLQLFSSAEPIEEKAADIIVTSSNAEPPERTYIRATPRLRICPDGIRFVAEDVTVLDTYAANRIEIFGKAWTGELPSEFYGTVTAALLASRGDLVLHGSAVTFGRRAVLLCGASGAGKSTLAAALIAAGGKLISDDLSAVCDSPAYGPLVLFPGRRTVKLFPDVAQLLHATTPIDILPGQNRRKRTVAPPHADENHAYALAAVLMLGSATPPAFQDKTTLLLEHSYRPRAFRHIPGYATRAARAMTIAATMPVIGFPPVEARDADSFRQAAESALRVCEAALN